MNGRKNNLTTDLAVAWTKIESDKLAMKRGESVSCQWCVCVNVFALADANR